MKRITLGIFAHVDSGKTTLTEAMLYSTNSIRKLGRVDHKDSFLDTDEQERARGITIYSKMAIMETENAQFTLVDTPGHVDFSLEAERTMAILDYALLVIDGKDGVTSHTKTLLDLIEKYKIPTFIFVNKMDMEGAKREIELEKAVDVLDMEAVAMASEDLMDKYLKGDMKERDIGKAIKERKLYPCFYGSALKLQGISELISGLERMTIEPEEKDEFGAKVFKIGRDKDTRLTYMKITGGSLKVRDDIGQKVSAIRLYSGEKYENIPEAFQGQVVAVTGLENTYVGMGLGFEEEERTSLTPVFTYKVKTAEDVFIAFNKLKALEEEDPSLNVRMRNESILVDVMGEIQLDVLKERLDFELSFEEGDIIYKESILEPVEGVGHYEPLKHYAEVHLLLEPGDGLSFGSLCKEDDLDRNWQRLILTHLMEKQHLGVLTGSAIDNMKISILSGKAHLKHTEGGDFRQATYRAVRNGLMKAKSVLLEPYYDFTISVPTQNVGRAMTDVKNMGGECILTSEGELSGSCPVRTMAFYQKTLTAYTKGKGILSTKLKGYFPSKDQEKIVTEMGYDAERDLENSADSIFCSHGAGVNIRWDQVEDYMHLPYSLKEEKKDSSNDKSEKDLNKIFEMTYGKPKERRFIDRKVITPEKADIDMSIKDEFLIVDGYNIIFASQLKELSLDSAREALLEILSNYQGFKKNRILVVFDSYKVKGAIENISKQGEIEVAFTKEGETADTFIEKYTYQFRKEYAIKVATSDALEQNSILAHGAMRMSARELLEDIKETNVKIEEIIKANNMANSRNRISIEAFEKRDD